MDLRGDRARARFYGQLAQLLESGISVDRALALTPGIGARPSGDDSGLVARLQRELGFGPVERAVLDAGLAAGELPESLRRLASRLEQRSRARRRVLTSLLYPCLLVHAALLLPPLGLLVSGGPALYLRVAVLPLAALWAVVLLGWLAFSRIRASPPLSGALDALLRQVPLVGPVVEGRTLAAYSGSLSLLIGSGLDLPRALDRAAEAVAHGNPARWAAAELRRGATLAEALAPGWPPDFVERVRVAEASGRLEEQLALAATHYEEEAATATNRLVLVLSVGIFLLAAGLVAVVVARSWLALLPEGL